MADFASVWPLVRSALEAAYPHLTPAPDASTVCVDAAHRLFVLLSCETYSTVVMVDLRRLKMSTGPAQECVSQITPLTAQTTQPVTLPADCFRLTIADSCHRICVVSRTECFVLELPSVRGATPVLKCDVTRVAKVPLSNTETCIVQATFHPLSSLHLLVLDTDNKLIMYNLAYTEAQPQRVELAVDLQPFLPHTDTFVSAFALASVPKALSEAVEGDGYIWGVFSIYLLCDNGGIGTLCPVFPLQVSLPRQLIDRLIAHTKTNVSIHSRRALDWLQRSFAKTTRSSADVYTCVRAPYGSTPLLQGPFYADVDGDSLYTDLVVTGPSNEPPTRLLRIGIRSCTADNNKSMSHVDVFAGLRPEQPRFLDDHSASFFETTSVDHKYNQEDDTHDMKIFVLADRVKLRSWAAVDGEQGRLMVDPLDECAVIAQSPGGVTLVHMPWLLALKTQWTSTNTEFKLEGIESEIVPVVLLDTQGRVVHGADVASRGVALISDPILGRYVVALGTDMQIHVGRVQRYVATKLAVALASPVKNVKLSSTSKGGRGLSSRENAILQQCLQRLAKIQVAAKKAASSSSSSSNTPGYDMQSPEDFAKFLVKVEEFKTTKKQFVRTSVELNHCAEELASETKQQDTEVQALIASVEAIRQKNTALKNQLAIQQQMAVKLASGLNRVLALQDELKPSSEAKKQFDSFIAACTTEKLPRLEAGVANTQRVADTVQSLRAKQVQESNNNESITGNALYLDKVANMYKTFLSHTSQLSSLKHRLAAVNADQS